MQKGCYGTFHVSALWRSEISGRFQHAAGPDMHKKLHNRPVTNFTCFIYWWTLLWLYCLTARTGGERLFRNSIGEVETVGESLDVGIIHPCDIVDTCCYMLESMVRITVRSNVFKGDSTYAMPWYTVRMYCQLGQGWTDLKDDLWKIVLILE